jgi:hypothetical protein
VADELVFEGPYIEVAIRVHDGRLVVTAVGEDVHHWTLTTEQVDRLSALITQTPTRL